MGGGAPGKAPPNQRSDLAPRPLSPGWDEVCRAIGELGVTAWAASCLPIPRPGSPSPHRKPLETFRETGCGLAAPFGYSISGVHRLWPTAQGRGPSASQPPGLGWGSGRVSTKGPDFASETWGREGEIWGFFQRAIRLIWGGGVSQDTSKCRLIYCPLSAGVGAALPLAGWVCECVSERLGEAGAITSLPPAGEESPTLALSSIMRPSVPPVWTRTAFGPNGPLPSTADGGKEALGPGSILPPWQW